MNFLSNLYFRMVQWTATFLMKCTNAVLRHFIKLQGKNPDFTAPVEQPKPAPAINDSASAWIVNTKSRPTRFGIASSDSWVRTIKDHPIIVSRKEFEEKQKEEKEKKIFEQTINEIGGDAISSLREAVSSIEKQTQVAAAIKKD